MGTGAEATEQILENLYEPAVLAQLFIEVVKCCKHSAIGKLLPNALYVHVSAIEALEPVLKLYESHARSHVEPKLAKVTLVKFNLDQPKISYLFYPEFESDAHPALQSSIQVDLVNHQIASRDYSDTDNPPILHRKETFVTPDHPLHKEFTDLTRAEEAAGLLDNSRLIGTYQAWQKRLQEYGVEIQAHRLIYKPEVLPQQMAIAAPTLLPQIERHRAAIKRTELSKPVRLALEAGLFSQESTFFDYGCGYGSDVQHIADRGYISAGWDPYYCSSTPHTPADIVNLGYVINVIEDPNERREALLKAWELTRKVLIVAAQVLIEDRLRGQIAYGDGIITRRHTFQKNYEQEELKTYIDQVLNVDAIPVTLGIYFVFRDRAQAQNFRQQRFRSRATTPRVKASIKRFEDYKELLAPLMAFVTERGRLPLTDELTTQPQLIAEFGTFRRAFGLVLQATDAKEWEAITEKRHQEILVYLALSHFDCRPKFRALSTVIQNDIKSLFGTYQQACTAADLMLLSLGEPGFISECCQRSKIGKYSSSGLYVHVSALEELDPMLRLYEGCANRTIGRMDGATIVKFHTNKPTISYLFYPNFDTEPHPALQTSMQIDLQDLHVSYRDYDTSEDPPILHRKEAYVLPSYPLYEKFAKLTKQEEDWGLLDDAKAISHRRGWLKCLKENCAQVQGHRVVWRKDADPYQVKLLRATIRARQAKSRDSNLSS